MQHELKVVFQPGGRTVYVLKGTSLLEAAARAGIILQSPCGGKGTCGKCAVHVSGGTCPPTAACAQVFSEAQLKKGMRLACQARVTEDCVVEIPSASRFDNTSKILTATHAKKVAVKAAVWKKYFELPLPTSTDSHDDLQRLQAAVGPIHVTLDTLRRLPTALRENQFRGTAVVCNKRLLNIEPGNTEATCYGVAFDLGSTTLVGVLLNTLNGDELGVAASLNPQVALGDDVISRISRVRDDAKALEELQAVVIRAFNDIIKELVQQAGIRATDIYEITVAGNTTMQHLFCGVSPAALGEVPFPPTFSRALMLDASELGLHAHPNARVYLFPNIGGFVGGDTVAGILATNIQHHKAATVLVDIGTNGEIVLVHGGKMLACSTAAGPAFEGARISAGMRATNGAIEKVLQNGTGLEYNVIGNVKPTGLCGTALIDLAAELLRAGVIDSTGRILPEDELPATTSADLRRRLVPGTNGQVDFELVPAAESGTGEAIVLRQRDVRELQLATAAIHAGILILLKQAGLTVADIDVILLAGGFGNFIRRNNARRIGLLPQIPTDKIRFVGNTSLMGAKAVLLSRDEGLLAEEIAMTAKHVDLSLDPEFQFEFSNAMLFPEDDLKE